MFEINIYTDMSINSLLKELDLIDQIAILNGHIEIKLNFKNCTYISPSILLVLVSYIDHTRIQGIDINVIVDRNPNIDTWISRLDFYEHLGLSSSEIYKRRNERGRFTTIKKIPDKDYYDELDEVIEILLSNKKLSSEISSIIDWSFNEILDNIFVHSESQVGGYLVTHSYKNKIEICIIDRGIGISESLKRNTQFENFSDDELLLKSTEANVTVGTGQGRGLYFTRKFIEENNGEMYIHSKNNKLFLRNKRIALSDNVYSWDGTIVKLIINKNNDNIDLKTFFESDKDISLPQKYLDGEFDEFNLW